jgi:glycosyltransferase involved in cell wall biosynthesis
MEGLPWGGSEVLWSRAARRLAASGETVAVSVRRWPVVPPHVRELEKAGCRVFFRSPPSLAQRALRRCGLLRRHPFRWLARFRPQLVVVSLGMHIEGIEAAQACRAYGLPYVLVIQSANEALWWPDALLDILLESYRGAAACWFVSENNRRLVETQLACRLPKAAVVRNPFNVCYEASPPWPDPSGGLRLACVGQLAPAAKGQDLIFEVLGQERWRRRGVKLSLFGGGQNERTVRRLAELYNLADVRFAGFAADVEGIWASHHALLLPSRHEGLPLAVVEAMLCGRVCIVTDVAGNAELIEDNVNSFLAAAPTVPLLAEAMDRAWERRDDWRRIGAVAAETVRRRVPPDPVAEFIGRLRRVCGASDPAAPG